MTWTARLARWLSEALGFSAPVLSSISYDGQLYTFHKPRYFEFEDGVLVEVTKPRPPDPNAGSATVTRIDRNAGTITLARKS